MYYIPYECQEESEKAEEKGGGQSYVAVPAAIPAKVPDVESGEGLDI